MDFEIPPEVIHDEVPGIHSISELSTALGEEALWKVFHEKEVSVSGFDLSNLYSL